MRHCSSKSINKIISVFFLLLLHAQLLLLFRKTLDFVPSVLKPWYLFCVSLCLVSSPFPRRRFAHLLNIFRRKSMKNLLSLLFFGTISLLRCLPVVLGDVLLDNSYNAPRQENSHIISASQDQPASSSSIALMLPTIPIGHDVHGLPVKMPLIGAGTWQYNDTIAYQSLCKAFQSGYTLVDTAFGYRNQRGVGRAIRDCFQNRRDSLFVLTKVPGGLTFQETLAAHHQNLFELELSYVDHLMVHFPADWEQNHASKSIRQAQWKALEEIYYAGHARSIGVSHYCSRHLHDILEISTVPIAINQVEYHVGSGDIDSVITTCRDNNITFMSFSPLCGPCQYDKVDSLIDGDLVKSIGEKYNKSGSQVSLRFIVQQALQPDSFVGPVIPKSNSIEHIRANMDIFDFELSKDDMERLFNATRPAAEGGDCDVP